MTLNDILPVLEEMISAGLRDADDLIGDGFEHIGDKFVSGDIVYFPSSFYSNGKILYRPPIRMKDLNNYLETEINGRN